MRIISIGVALFLIIHIVAVAQPANSNSEINTFNKAFADATRRMDNTATLALRAEDGISLLPSTEPIVGKAAVATFLENVTSQIKGATMESFDMECFDIIASGDFATEWCTEHQVVRLGEGKPPFDGRGRMLLVLRRSASGVWRIEREMWNQSK